VILLQVSNRIFLDSSNLAGVRYYTESTSAARRSKQTSNKFAHSPTFEDVLRLSQQGNPRAVEAIEKMGHYLGVGIAMLVTGLAPDVIVVVGEVTRMWNRIGPIIASTAEKRLSNRYMTRILPSDPAGQPRLVGTIALVLQRHFGAPAVG